MQLRQQQAMSKETISKEKQYYFLNGQPFNHHPAQKILTIEGQHYFQGKELLSGENYQKLFKIAEQHGLSLHEFTSSKSLLLMMQVQQEEKAALALRALECKKRMTKQAERQCLEFEIHQLIQKSIQSKAICDQLVRDAQQKYIDMQNTGVSSETLTEAANECLLRVAKLQLEDEKRSTIISQIQQQLTIIANK